MANSSADNGMMKSSSFYSKQVYLTPLQRQQLKRKLGETALDNVTNSPLQDKPVKKKNSSLKKKRHRSKENRPHPPTPTPKPVSISESAKPVNPTVFLKKKDESITNRKFFKSRPSDAFQQNGTNITCKSIHPLDMKAASAFVQDSRKSSGTNNDNLHQTGHLHNDKLNKTTTKPAVLWIQNSFEEQNTGIHDNAIQLTNEMGEQNANVQDTVESSHHIDKRNVSVQDNVVEGSNENDAEALLDNSESSEDNEIDKSHVEDDSSSEKSYPVFHFKEKNFYKKIEEKSSSPSSSSVHKPVQRHKMDPTKDKDQMMIDAGQKRIGAQECPTCGMVYHIGNNADEAVHSQFHDSYLTTLKFPGWKKEKIIGKFLDGRVVMVTPEDQSYMLQKIDDVLLIVNRFMGFTNISMPTSLKVMHLLFVTFDGKIAGCLVAEPVSKAFKVRYDSTLADIIPCTEDTVKTLCGINRLWVAHDYRRNKIASRLLDCLRCNFIYGYAISLEELAFLDPTLDGQKFASSYCENNEFLVYLNK